MRAIFMGTPALAVPTLDALFEVADVVGVICQPDKPAGRGMQLHAPPVKERAVERGVEVLQPTKMRDGAVARWMRDKAADVAVVIAFGRILPREVLDAPRAGCLNVHASLLPKYRGAAPIQWAIARGERETGVALMQMDEGLDTGPVLAELRTEIGPDETSAELGHRLAQLAGDLVRANLREAVTGTLVARPQDHARATLAPILRKEDGVVDWSKPARAIHDHVRGMNPWPAATTSLGGIGGKTLRILRTRVLDDALLSREARAPGKVLVADKSGVVVACGPAGEEAIAIVEAQPEGKKAMRGVDLVNGRVLSAGVTLGAPGVTPARHS